MAQSRPDIDRVVLIVNPTSGGGRGARVLPAALAAFERLGVKPDVRVTTSGDEPASLAHYLAETGAGLVVSVGGDGHAAAVAEGLLAVPAQTSPPPLAILPAGSANDLARNLRLPVNDVDRAVDLICGGITQRIDAIRVRTEAGERIFLNVVGAGFDAEVAEAAHDITVMRGAGRYVLAIMRVLPGYSAAHLRLTLDGATHALPAMMVAVANGPAYGGGMRVAPAARYDSGELEVCIVGDLSKPAFLRAFPRVFRGTHISHPAVTMLRAREITIEADRPLHIIGDGERAGTLPVTLTVNPRALEVVTGTAVAQDNGPERPTVRS